MFLHKYNFSCTEQHWNLLASDVEGYTSLYFFYALMVSKLGDLFVNNVFKQ